MRVSSLLCLSAGVLPLLLGSVPDSGREAETTPAVLPLTHIGPAVQAGRTGPARFVDRLYDRFDLDGALKLMRFLDGYYRTPGAAGYNTCIARIEEELRAAGFGEDPRLTLRVVETPMQAPAWLPVAASIEVEVEGAEPRRLHHFEKASDTDRVMLPINAPAADVRGPIALGLEKLSEGGILVTDSNLHPSLLRKAKKRGAVAVFSSALFPFTVDPSGGERHLDAVLFATVPPGTRMPVAQISPRTHQELRDLVAKEGEVVASFEARVEFVDAPLRTLVAEVIGEKRPEEAVAIVSHVQEPGAADNASGAAGLTGMALALTSLVRDGDLAWPDRTVAFVWGDEMRLASVWLDDTKRRTVAGISADMLGESREKTGAICLLERMPDPGAIDILPPDEHTPWGAGHVDVDDLQPNGLAIVARTALFDVSEKVGGWLTSENPWEGGSDHDVFLASGIPAVLIWHFTDFTYHTSLDRMDVIDPEELRRTSVAVLAAGLAVADPEPADLERYLGSANLERMLRLEAARADENEACAGRWEAWFECVDDWLRELCRER